MTTGVVVTTEWTQLTDAAGDYNVQNQSVEKVLYRTQTAPGDQEVVSPTASGLALRPWETHPVYVPDGEVLYGRVREASTGRRALVVFTLAAEPPV